AEQAKYDYLCFVHEDVRFMTEGWGERLAQQLQIPDCGVVGFAGSILKLRRLTGWNTCNRDLRANYVQGMRGGHHARCVNPHGVDFSPVVTLDGLCLFVRREVWRQTPFDAVTFPGFHCYDLDFSMAVARNYKNYVCHTVLVEHFSEGAFSVEWVEQVKRLHAKWNDCLPMMAETLSVRQLARYDRLGEAFFIKFMLQKGCFEVCGWSEVMHYLVHHPLHLTAWTLLPKYVKYKLRALHKIR
ncbi:MAG: glycosyltransferase, partial [Alistipes sp.]